MLQPLCICSTKAKENIMATTIDKVIIQCKNCTSVMISTPCLIESLLGLFQCPDCMYKVWIERPRSQRDTTYIAIQIEIHCDACSSTGHLPGGLDEAELTYIGGVTKDMYECQECKHLVRIKHEIQGICQNYVRHRC